MIMQSILYYTKNPNLLLKKVMKKYGRWIPDSIYLRIMFYLYMGKRLNLHNPKTYSEKLQWLKLYNRNPEYTLMVDKYAVKDYVVKIVGEQYVIPTLGVWDNPEDIDWDTLPDQFVLKTTHGGGNKGVIICKDKLTFDKEDAFQRLHQSLRQDIYRNFREWPYKNVRRRIIAEKYMEDSEHPSSGLADYKFFCFDGEPKAMYIATDRNDPMEETKFDFFDMTFHHLPFTNGHPNSSKDIPVPTMFEEMKMFATKLSQGLPHVRIDMYVINNRIYFGEMTFFHWSGLKPFIPEKWDELFGSYLKLPL